MKIFVYRSRSVLSVYLMRIYLIFCFSSTRSLCEFHSHKNISSCHILLFPSCWSFWLSSLASVNVRIIVFIMSVNQVSFTFKVRENPSIYYLGKKCFSENHETYTCCDSKECNHTKILIDFSLFIVNDPCENGRCSSLDAPSSGLPIHVSILIGVGACVFVLVCIVVISAVYWHRQEMNIRKRLFNPFASFSRANDTSSRVNSFSNPSTSTSTDGTVNLKIHSTMKV